MHELLDLTCITSCICTRLTKDACWTNPLPQNLYLRLYYRCIEPQLPNLPIVSIDSFLLHPHNSLRWSHIGQGHILHPRPRRRSIEISREKEKENKATLHPRRQGEPSKAGFLLVRPLPVNRQPSLCDKRTNGLGFFSLLIFGFYFIFFVRLWQKICEVDDIMF